MAAKTPVSPAAKTRSAWPAPVAVVTDSVAQVPVELANTLAIRIVPFTVVVEGKTYLDGIQPIPTDLYSRMRLEKDLHLSTSAPSLGVFFTIFQSCIEAGAREILYIGLSGQLSGALTTAQSAALMIREEQAGVEIACLDSRLATIAEGFLAIEAARLAAQGLHLAELLSRLEALRRRIGFVGSLETLEYLARGGRIGKAAYLLSNATQILPLLSFNDEGEVIPINLVHGYQHALEEMVHYTRDHAPAHNRLTLAVMHADSLAWAESLCTLADERLDPEELLLVDFTPVMVAHSGPGILGLAFLASG